MFINNTVFLNKMNYNLKKNSTINTLDKIISDTNYNKAIQQNFDRAELKKDIISKLKETDYNTVSIGEKPIGKQIGDYIEKLQSKIKDFKNTLIEYDKQITDYKSVIEEGKGTPLIEKCIESLKSQKQEYFDKNSSILECATNYMEIELPFTIRWAVCVTEKMKNSSVYTEYKDMIYEDKNGKKYVYDKVCTLNKKFYQDFDMSCFNNFKTKLEEILTKDHNDKDFYSALDSYIANIGRARSVVANIFSKLE